MFVLYILFGFLIYAATGTAPSDPLRAIQADPSKRPRQREMLAAVAVWCAALPLWPIALVLGATRTITRRHPR
ncbi:hypothetical protein [Streptomyces sp. NPDC002067]